MGRTPTSRGGFSGRRRPIASLNKRSSLNDSAKKSGEMEEESKIDPKPSGMFDSSDDEDNLNSMMMKQGDQKNLEKEALKATPTSKPDEGEKLNFEFGDFVAEANDKIENKYYFMKPPLGVGLFGTVYKARHKESG